MNDKICQAYGLSVPTPKRERSLSQGEMGAEKYEKSFKEKLRHSIDTVLLDCMDFEEFLVCMREEGYEVRHRGKSLEFRVPDQLRFTHSFCLGDEYTEEALWERIAGHHKEKAAKTTAEKTEAGKKHSTTKKNINLLVDIQAKMQAVKGKGYERENGVADYDELATRVDSAGQKFDSLSARIKQLEGRMAEVAQLKMHIINYSETWEIYSEYKKSRQKNEFLVEHADDIKNTKRRRRSSMHWEGKRFTKWYSFLQNI